MSKLEVGMYVRGKYYTCRGKIGKIVKNYNGDLEIAYQDGLLKTTVSSFIDDNYDINGKQYVASYNIIDLIEVGDYVNGFPVIHKENDILKCGLLVQFKENEIKSIVTKEQFEAMTYKVSK